MSDEKKTPELQPIMDRGFRGNLHLLLGNWDFKPIALAHKTLDSVTVSDDKEKLVFTLVDGRTITFEAEGDCCSSTWIEHIIVPPDIAGAVVTGVTEQDMGQFEDEKEYATIKVYQTSFVTDRGEIVVEYRNSSNGYYGGSLRGPVEPWADQEARALTELAQRRAELGDGA